MLIAYKILTKIIIVNITTIKKIAQLQLEFRLYINKQKS